MPRPFLTDLDSRAKIKGSRDPLGIQRHWTALGREAVGNLTTVSNSVRDFTTLLVGRWLAQEVVAVTGEDDELSVFLRWEQLAAYARGRAGDFSFRGVERVRVRLGESSRKIILSAAPGGQILSNQKIYGLWGLFTMPALASGLLAGSPTRLMPEARNEVARRLRAARIEPTRLIEQVKRERAAFDVEGELAKRVGENLLGKNLDETEREFYRRHLWRAEVKDATAGRQALLAELLDGPESPEKWHPPAIMTLAKAARRRGETGEALGERLVNIAVAEAVFAPAADLFSYLLGCPRMRVDELHTRVASAWGKRGVASVDAAAFAAASPSIIRSDVTTRARWEGVARDLRAGDYAALIRRLLEENREVMWERGSAAPWVVEENGCLDVRMGDEDESGDLPTAADLPTLWRHPFFLPSLQTIGRQLQSGGTRR